MLQMILNLFPFQVSTLLLNFIFIEY